ncbi:MAG: hypothetical protein HUJ95_01435 [Bacteroidales bacterium]|nr:hypothetical protein [Bacteroidales bacterium]
MMEQIINLIAAAEQTLAGLTVGATKVNIDLIARTYNYLDTAIKLAGEKEQNDGKEEN